MWIIIYTEKPRRIAELKRNGEMSPIHFRLIRPSEKIINGAVENIRDTSERERIHSSNIIDLTDSIHAETAFRQHVFHAYSVALTSHFNPCLNRFGNIHKSSPIILCINTKSRKFVFLY